MLNQAENLATRLMDCKDRGHALVTIAATLREFKIEANAQDGRLSTLLTEARAVVQRRPSTRISTDDALACLDRFLTMQSTSRE